MTNLQRILEIYDRRSQFHDRTLLDKLINTVREEEREKCAKLIAAMEVANLREPDMYENQIRAQVLGEAKRRIRENGETK